MNEMAIHFHESGNSILGNYSAYRALELAIKRKSVPPPFGYCVKGDITDIHRLTEYVDLFGYCIRGLEGWRAACHFGGVTLEVSR